MKNKTKDAKIPHTNLRQISLDIYSEKSGIISEEDFKFMIDKSILSTFGILEANKIKYLIKKDGNSKYILKTYDR